MKNIYLTIFITLHFCLNCSAQENKNAEYEKVISQRAEKIVNTLEITDSLKFRKVCTIIANQYRNLSFVHDTRNEKVKAIKSDSLKSKPEKDSLIKILDAEADIKIQKLHNEYIAALLKELTSEQVDKVKDGMTFNVLSRTYNGYIEMILTLTDAQKKQIWDWLIEAREKAMDAESSDKKHAVFGKYKGRINNYLSKEGYDLKKEGEEWKKRINAEADSIKKK